MTDLRGGVCFGPFVLNPGERLLLRDGRVVPLTPKAFDLLALLVANAGHLLSKEELIEKLWPGTFVEEANLAYNVSTIRKAFGDGSDTDRYIETVPRRGYRFVGPMTPTVTHAHEQPDPHDEVSSNDGRAEVTGRTAALTSGWTDRGDDYVARVDHNHHGPLQGNTGTIRGGAFPDSRLPRIFGVQRFRDFSERPAPGVRRRWSGRPAATLGEGLLDSGTAQPLGHGI